MKSHQLKPTVSFNGGNLDCGNGLLLLIRKHIDPLNPGELLEIISLESSVDEDLPAWCRLTNNELVSYTKNGEERSFLVSKGLLSNEIKNIEKITPELNTNKSPSLKIENRALSEIKNFSVIGIGSWPRPSWLIKILHEFLENRISESEFTNAAEVAIRLCVQAQIDSGADIISDGEQRRDNYSSFVGTKLTNCQLIPLTDLFALVDDPEKFKKELAQLDVPASEVRHPAIFGKIKREKPLTLDEAIFLKTLTDKPIKIALPGPYLLTRTMWMDCISDSHYSSREELSIDIVKILREELGDLIKFGVELIQFDEPVLSEVAFGGDTKNRSFMCGALGEKKPRVEELNFAADLLEAVIKDFPKEQVAVHICRGNWTRDETKALSGPYEKLIPYFEKITAGNLFLEFSTPRAGELNFIKKLGNRFNLGIGLVNQKLDSIEDSKELTNRINEALEILGKSFDKKIFITPDCGFATFADSPISAPELAKEKIKVLKRTQSILKNKR
jgi:5-methyltetrahydropteroyltriglutamate--homocysteine methyltransferase